MFTLNRPAADSSQQQQQFLFLLSTFAKGKKAFHSLQECLKPTATKHSSFLFFAPKQTENCLKVVYPSKLVKTAEPPAGRKWRNSRIPRSLSLFFSLEGEENERGQKPRCAPFRSLTFARDRLPSASPLRAIRRARGGGGDCTIDTAHVEQQRQ